MDNSALITMTLTKETLTPRERCRPASTLTTDERAMGHGCRIRVEFLAVHAHAVEWEGVSMLCFDQMEIFAAVWEIEHTVKMIWI